jgi:hypothetical protein
MKKSEAFNFTFSEGVSTAPPPFLFLTIKALMLLFHNLNQENNMLFWCEIIKLVHKRAQLQVLQWRCIISFNEFSSQHQHEQGKALTLCLTQNRQQKCTLTGNLYRIVKYLVCIFVWLFIRKLWGRNEHHYHRYQMSCGLSDVAGSKADKVLPTRQHKSRKYELFFYIHVCSYTLH